MVAVKARRRPMPHGRREGSPPDGPELSSAISICFWLIAP